MNDPEIQQRSQRFEALFREHGLPLTVQRRDIVGSVLQCDDHPSADQVRESVKDRISDLSRTTVCRGLGARVGLGVLRRLYHSGAGTRYDGKIRRHYHLTCRTCHRVADVESKKLDDRQLVPSQRRGFVIEDCSVSFVGVC